MTQSSMKTVAYCWPQCLFALVCGAALCFSVGGCAVNQGPGAYTVTQYAATGKVIQTWQSLGYVDPIWNNSHIEFNDANGKQHYLFGTAVVERGNASSPSEATHTVTLYASDGSVIRAWQAFSVDPHWNSDFVRFYSAETGNEFSVFGSVHVEQK